MKKMIVKHFCEKELLKLREIGYFKYMDNHLNKPTNEQLINTIVDDPNCLVGIIKCPILGENLKFNVKQFEYEV